MKKVRQFESVKKALKLNLSITTDAINLGLIDTNGNPTEYAFKINNTSIKNSFGHILDNESYNQMCECERVSVAIRCHFMALPGIPKASLQPIKRQLIRVSKKVPKAKAIESLKLILSMKENDLLKKEHYEDLEHWQGIKAFILDEAEKIYGHKIG